MKNNIKYIFGYHSVLSILQSTAPVKVKEIYLQHKQTNKRQLQVIAIAEELGITIKYFSSKYFNNLVNSIHHQGVIAAIEYRDCYTEEYLMALIKHEVNPSFFFLILDGIQDPHNLGACLRTANAAGVDAVIITRNQSCSITPTVYKTASGAIGNTPIIKVTNLARTIEFLKNAGIWIYGTTEKSENDIYHTILKKPLAIIFGAEGSGMRRLTQNYCDTTVNIPMMGNVQNLNVSVAVGIFLFEVNRQQLKA